MKKISLFKSVPTGTEIEAFSKVLNSNWWDKGPIVEQFEKEFAALVGAKYAVATNSCTMALEIAVQIAELPEEVTVSPFTFISSAACILRAGKKVKFVDIDEYTKCAKKADIQVLYAGNEVEGGYIYDMAHFGGGTHKGLISCWSFQARKNIPCGDGGMLTTNNEALYKRAKAISWYGVEKSTHERSLGTYAWDYNLRELGTKGNMNDLVASIGLEQLKALPQNQAKRELIASWYDKYLSDAVVRPYPSKTWHLYTIQVKNRDLLYQVLANNGVTAGVHYRPLYKYDIFPQTVMPTVEKVFNEIISLPMHVDLTEEDVKYICALI
jgi:perosamine synthetase